MKLLERFPAAQFSPCPGGFLHVMAFCEDCMKWPLFSELRLVKDKKGPESKVREPLSQTRVFRLKFAPYSLPL